jgi:hypothetical protein
VRIFASTLIFFKFISAVIDLFFRIVALSPVRGMKTAIRCPKLPAIERGLENDECRFGNNSELRQPDAARLPGNRHMPRNRFSGIRAKDH